MKYIHPPYRFVFTDLTKVDLSGYEDMMSGDCCWNYFSG